MLRYWFIPHLQDLRLLDRVWFQLDVASAHYAVGVRQKHNEVLPDRWIGRGSGHLLRLWIDAPKVLTCHLAKMHYGGSLSRKLLSHITRQLMNLRMLFDVHLLPSR